MAKISTLASLVNSLTRAEKRYFKLQTSLQKGSKEYVRLFKIIEKGTEASLIKKTFEKQFPGAVYSSALKHLYSVVMDCLLHLRMEQDKSTLLFSSILKANVLFEKSLYAEGFDALKKTQIQAEEYEQHLIQLWAARLELYYLCNLNFHAVTENELIKKQMKIQEIMRHTVNSHHHNSLYELLRYRLVYKGHVRTGDQKKELNDLVVSEMNIVANFSTDTVESYKTHLLFQAHYFIAINDYQSAIKTFYELNELLEQNSYLWIDSPIDYLSAIEGILDSLRTIRHYDEMQYFLEKLQKFPRKSVYFEVMVQRVIYLYSIAALIDRGDFKKAILLQQNFMEGLFKKIEVLDPDKQAEVYLYAALAHFSNNDLNNAHKYLGKVLFQGKQYYNLPVFQTFRLLHLLVHYELQNHDVVFHGMRAVKRTLKNGRNKTYKMEKIIFSFLQIPNIPSSSKERKALAEKFKNLFDQIATDKYEIQVLKIFDFSAWIEAKLSKRPFEKVLKEKSI